MPVTGFPPSFIAASNNLQQNPWIYLVTLYLTPTTVLRLTNYSENVVFDGKFYSCDPGFSINDINMNATGELEVITMILPSPGGIFLNYLSQYDGLIRNRVILTLVHSDYLSDPTAKLDINTYIAATSFDYSSITLTLASKLDETLVRVPRRRITKTRCTANYKGEGCWHRVDTNLIQQPENYNHSYWTKAANVVLTANHAVEPLFGLSTAFRMQTNADCNSYITVSGGVAAPGNKRLGLLDGRTFTVSLYMKAVSSGSALSVNFRIARSGGGGGTTVGTQQVVNLSTAWTRYSSTGTYPTGVNEYTLRFYICECHATVNDFHVAHIQLEENDHASPFESLELPAFIMPPTFNLVTVDDPTGATCSKILEGGNGCRAHNNVERFNAAPGVSQSSIFI